MECEIVGRGEGGGGEGGGGEGGGGEGGGGEGGGGKGEALLEMERQLAAKNLEAATLTAERDAEMVARREAEERAAELQQEVEDWEHLSRDTVAMREAEAAQGAGEVGALTQQVDDLWAVVEEPGDEVRERDQELMRKVRLLLERALNRIFGGRYRS